MFSERKTRHDLSPKDHFSRGKNNKLRHFTADAWLEGVKERMLEKIKALIPSYERKPSRGETKIGPKLKMSGASYEAGRLARADKVFKLREDEKTLASIVSLIACLSVEKKPSALDRVLSKPRPVPQKSALFQSPAAQAGLAKMRARAEKPAATVGISKLDVAAKAAAQRAAEQKVETKTIEREAAHDLTAGRRSTKAQLDAEFRRIWKP